MFGKKNKIVKDAKKIYNQASKTGKSVYKQASKEVKKVLKSSNKSKKISSAALTGAALSSGALSSSALSSGALSAKNNATMYDNNSYFDTGLIKIQNDYLDSIKGNANLSQEQISQINNVQKQLSKINNKLGNSNANALYSQQKNILQLKLKKLAPILTMRIIITQILLLIKIRLKLKY